MRYLFEERLYTERAKGEVGVTRIKELMLDAQRECYGDTLAEAELDPWFWASKLHFYITGVSFYNYPYTFGYLFSRGLSARFRAEGASFLPKYEELLRLTGSASADDVARQAIGVDLSQPTFWRGAMDGLEQALAAFEEVAPRALAK
jgi:oligoendopeptidase F